MGPNTCPSLPPPPGAKKSFWGRNTVSPLAEQVGQGHLSIFTYQGMFDFELVPNGVNSKIRMMYIEKDPSNICQFRI